MDRQTSTSSWTRTDLLHPHEIPDKSRRVRHMFDDIAAQYDFMNHLLSLNLDRGWRKTAAQLLHLAPNQTVLDLCCGTGDLALTFLRREPKLKNLIGLDFSEKMLRQARQKRLPNHLSPLWLQGDAEILPFLDGSFHRIGCAFGIRNLQNPKIAFQHLYRILKPQGRVVILEFDLPDNPVLRWIYQFYFRLVLPALAGIMVKDNFKAYDYLPESVKQYDTQRKITALLQESGFQNVQIQRLSFGVVLAFTADKL